MTEPTAPARPSAPHAPHHDRDGEVSSCACGAATDGHLAWYAHLREVGVL